MKADLLNLPLNIEINWFKFENDEIDRMYCFVLHIGQIAKKRTCKSCVHGVCFQHARPNTAGVTTNNDPHRKSTPGHFST